MSSHKRRNRDKHSPSSSTKHKKSNLHGHANINDSYEHVSYEDGDTHRERGNGDGDNYRERGNGDGDNHRERGNGDGDNHRERGTKDGEYRRKNKKHRHSKERNYEKTKKTRLYESDDEQYERHSEIPELDRKRKKENYTDGKDHEAKEHRNVDDDDDYHSKNKSRNSDSEHKSYSRREKRREKSDKNRNYQAKESLADEDGDDDYYSSNKVRNKNRVHNSFSQKGKRYEKYDHSSENEHSDPEPQPRDSTKSTRHLYNDSDDNRYASSRVDNSEQSSYSRKDKKYKKFDHNYESYGRDGRRNEAYHEDRSYSRIKVMDHARQDISSSESFRSRHGNIHSDDCTQSSAEAVNHGSRNKKNDNLNLDSDVNNAKEKETSLSDARAPKKMISGAYIPPAKLKLMQQEITDKGSIEYQRIAWEALKKSINGLTNKVNTANIAEIVKELFKENIIRGRGVLTRGLMQAQALSPTFTHVYAALVAIINTKFPDISELLLKRLILQFKRGFRRNDKQACLSSVRFIAHLLNQQVAHEVLILEVLTLLLEHPTDHSVEVAIAMLKECGKRLEELSKRGCDAIFSRLRHVLHEGNLDKRTQYMIEVLFAVRKDKFKDYQSVEKGLDLVEENEKFTHLVTLDEALDAEEMLNVFKFDPEYQANEERYKELVNEILGYSESEDSGDSEAEGTESDEENDEDGEHQKIIDMTETNLVALRRNIYLTIQSSLDFEECAHKLLKMELKPGEIMEMCYMILDCCAQQRTYEKFYGLLAQRFCQLNKVYLEPFMEIFRNSYETIHRLETNKLRNVAKFFAHLLYTDAIHWNVLANIKLNENDTTSSSRIFIKILFQELCDYMGLPMLNERIKDVTLQEAFDGLFPRDNPQNTRFAINFFTSIGLGGLTDELREHLKSAPKNPPPVIEKPSESDSEDEEPPRKRKKTQKKKHKH